MDNSNLEERSKVTPYQPSRWEILHSARWMKLVRFTAFIVVLAGIGMGVTYSHVKSQVGERMMSFGESFMRYDNAERQDGTRELRLNGQTVNLSSGTTTDSVDAVLDEFEERCRLSNVALQQEVAVAVDADDSDHFVMREEGGGSGTVGCLDFGAELSLVELAERAHAFQASNDLHDLGDLRYVYATPLDHNRGTHFITFWTTGSLNFNEVTGNNGNNDVPGSDLADIPRPPRSIRVIDAEERGVNQRVLSYTGSSMTQWELEAFYRDELTASGYRVFEAPPDRMAVPGLLMGAERDGQMTLITLDTDSAGLGNVTILTGG